MYAIIDIETTGGSPDRDRITEIAVIIHDGKQVLKTWESLINPECAIPPFITTLTGINNAMVRDAPKFHEIAKELVEITQGQIFVAHNVRFDYGFISAEFNRLGYRYIRKQLCTCRLSRKIAPQLPRHNLDTVVNYYGISIPPEKRHRAMGDAAATAEVFKLMLDSDKSKDVLADLLHAGVKEASLPPHITLDLLHSLPEDCGVYYFLNKDKDITYVGKSVNIKKRVMQHFSDKKAKEMQMAQTVHDIHYEVTGSELVSLLLEDREIKTKQPVYNRAQRQKKLPYAIFEYQNVDGTLSLRSDKTTGHKQKPLATFERPIDAKMVMSMLTKQFDLCGKANYHEGKEGQCFRLVCLCKTKTVNEEEIANYNASVKRAIALLQTDFTEDAVYLDKGRHSKEQAAIVIKDGKYSGYAYFEQDEQLGLEDILDRLTPGEHHADTVKIIKIFLSKNKLKKISL